MPYESCPQCGLRTYCVSGEECPRCGTPLGGEPRVAVRPADWARDAPAGEPRGAVEHVLAVARRELRMDIALLSEVREGREIVLWAVGNGRLPGFVPGASAPLRDTICRRLLDGTIDHIVHDARTDARVRDLPAAQAAGLGAYIGVPLTGAAARRYVLCCVAREARPDLSEGDVRFLRGLVESVRPAVDRAAGAS
jgi:GAF domain-containing protein/ribosomal protein L37E